MADKALFLGWNRPVIGREKEAAALFAKTLEYYGELQSKGTIESFEPVIMSRHGGDLNGFVLVRGETDKLNALKEDSQFLDLVIETGHVCEGFGIVDCYLGAKLMDVMARWTKTISQ